MGPSMSIFGQDVRGVSPVVGTLVLMATVILAVTTVGVVALGMDIDTTADMAKDLIQGKQPNDQKGSGEKTTTHRKEETSTSQDDCLPEEASTTAKENAQCRTT